MTFAEQILLVMRVRSSCRYFEDKPISQEEKDILIRSIDGGPSSGGLRAYQIYHTEDFKKKIALQKAALNQQFISKAAIIFCICADPKKSQEKYGERGMLYAIQDATIAGMQITFAATALLLGSCWVGSIDSSKVKDVYKISDSYEPLSLICIGHWKDNRGVGGI